MAAVNFDTNLALGFEKWLRADRELRLALKKAEELKRTKTDLEKEFPQIGNLKGMLKKQKEKKLKTSPTPPISPSTPDLSSMNLTDLPPPETASSFLSSSPPPAPPPVQTTTSTTRSSSPILTPIPEKPGQKRAAREKIDNLAKIAKKGGKKFQSSSFDKHLDD